MKKRILSLLLATTMVLTTVGCGQTNEGQQEPKTEGTIENVADSADFSVGMVPDVGGINDQSYNQAAWEGLEKFKEETGANVSYVETIQTSDLSTNFDKMIDEEHDLLWGIGFNTAEPMKAIAEMNPDQKFAIVDYDFGDETLDNIANVVFNVEDASFLVGYIAGLTTETNRVGYIGGMKTPTMDLFEYGYKAGVAYAAKELGKEITVDVQIAESFTDAAKGKAIAATMYSNGNDILFPAAGNTGTGVIEQAAEEDKLVIGVDRDQSYLAPDNVLTSAMKNVGLATFELSKKVMDGEEIGGQTFYFDMANGGVGIPEENPNMDPAVYEKALEVQELIKNGDIVAPNNEEAYNEFIK